VRTKQGLNHSFAAHALLENGSCPLDSACTKRGDTVKTVTGTAEGTVTHHRSNSGRGWKASNSDAQGRSERSSSDAEKLARRLVLKRRNMPRSINSCRASSDHRHRRPSDHCWQWQIIRAAFGAAGRTPFRPRQDGGTRGPSRRAMSRCGVCPGEQTVRSAAARRRGRGHCARLDFRGTPSYRWARRRTRSESHVPEDREGFRELVPVRRAARRHWDTDTGAFFSFLSSQGASAGPRFG